MGQEGLSLPRCIVGTDSCSIAQQPGQISAGNYYCGFSSMSTLIKKHGLVKVSRLGCVVVLPTVPPPSLCVVCFCAHIQPQEIVGLLTVRWSWHESVQVDCRRQATCRVASGGVSAD